MEENKIEQNHQYSEYQSLAFHPYNVLLILLLIALSILFLALTASFIYTRIEKGMPPLKLPLIFLLNTIILLGSSATMVWAKKCYLNDQTKKYQQALMATIGLSILFMIAQFIGWRILFSQNVFINTDLSASYLYVISGLHFAHVIGGLPFLILFLRKARKQMVEPVSVLVYFSDPEKRLKLRLLTIYWHFLDGLWIYLIIFLYLNYLIR